MQTSFLANHSDLRTFAEYLARDLRRLGHELELSELNSALHLKLTAAEKNLTKSEIKDCRDQAFTRAHKNFLRRTQGEIQRLRSKHDLNQYFPEVYIDTKKIRLEITPIEQDDQGLVRLLSLYPRATSFPRGRKISFLLWDTGQMRPCLVGLVTLASPQYFHHARDAWLDWVDLEQGATHRHRKNLGLRHTYNIANSFAFGCYQTLFGAKIAALVPFTDVVRDAVTSRFGEVPLAFTTSGLLGSYAKPFQRINTKHFRSLSSNTVSVDRCFYRTLGAKTPPRACLSESLSDKTVEVAWKIASAGGVAPNPRGSATFGRSERYKVVSVALKQLGIPNRVLFGGPGQSYIGYSRSECVDALRSIDQQEPPTNFCITERELQDYWLRHWIVGKGRSGKHHYSVRI